MHRSRPPANQAPARSASPVINAHASLALTQVGLASWSGATLDCGPARTRFTWLGACTAGCVANGACAHPVGFPSCIIRKVRRPVRPCPATRAAIFAGGTSGNSGAAHPAPESVVKMRGQAGGSDGQSCSHMPSIRWFTGASSNGRRADSAKPQTKRGQNQHNVKNIYIKPCNKAVPAICRSTVM